MSDDVLQIIPTAPRWVPTRANGAAAVAALREMTPLAGEATARLSDEVELVDAGANFESIRCPLCGDQIDIEWWQSTMSDAFEASRFDDLSITTPCCSSPSSLNDLVYDWPQGFSRWRAEVFNPDRGPLSEEERTRIGQLLGHDVREIWTHV
jgi:hypothetical protein